MKHVPCVRLLIPFVGGILCEPLMQEFYSHHFYLLGGIVVLLCMLPLISLSFRLRWIRGVVIFLSLFLTGGSLYHLSGSHISYEKIQEYNRLGIVVTESKNISPERYRIIGKVKFLGKHESVRVGKVLIYVPVSNKAKNLVYGDLIYIDNELQPITSSRNKYIFNFKRFWERKSIYYQAFLTNNQWSPSFVNMGNPLVKRVKKIQHTILTQAEKDGITGNEKAVFSALFLGDRYYLDDELRQNWADAGAIHILAVSGLHVGIIYIILNSIFISFFRDRKLRIAATVIIIIILWTYACFTGFSVSVIRAVTMFSFIAIGKSYSRYINIYNIMAASALLILVIDPQQLFSVGFQLSYLAVTGIVTFYPYLYAILRTNYLIIDKIWQLTCVSIAAQLSTFPLTVFYFHQFPVLFLISNLLVIPLATIIVYMSLLYIICIPLHLSLYVAYALKILLRGSNLTVDFVHRIEFSTLDHLFLSQWGLFILYIMLLSLAVFFIKKHKFWLKAVLMALIIFVASDIYNDYRQRMNPGLIFYTDQYKINIGIIRNKKLQTLIINSDNDTGDIPFNLEYYLSQTRYKFPGNAEILAMSDTVNYLLDVGGIKTFVMNNADEFSENKKPDNIQYVVINYRLINNEETDSLSNNYKGVLINYCRQTLEDPNILCMNKELVTFFPINLEQKDLSLMEWFDKIVKKGKKL